ncbi:MAG: polyphosphate:AMP phosphotransferase [Candidatus Krumholzibacteriia bacterium]
MLETLDLSRKLDSATARTERRRLGAELSRLQRAAFVHGLPALLVFEGLDGAGKGDSLAHLVAWLDPRGFKVYAPREPSAEESLRPAWWRYWLHTPARGELALFDRSWHGELMQRRLDGALDDAAWARALAQAREFERQLAADGTVVLKFWLQVSHAERRRRVEAWANDEHQRWRAELARKRRAHGWRKSLRVVEEVLARTHTPEAPWVLLEADDDEWRRVGVMREAAAALRRGLAARGVTVAEPSASDGAAPAAAVAPTPDPLPPGFAGPAASPLAGVDLTRRLDPADYRRELDAAQARLRDLHFAGYVGRRATIVAFEGWDAAGKGSAIKRLAEKLDPRGYAVIPVAAPSAGEQAHHYLWRFWRDLPKGGHLAVFDRTWYGRVLVERVEGLAAEAAWRRAYAEINEFERVLTEAGVGLVKFWLQISPQEQLRRFRAREADPDKRFKLVADDWRNRAKWPQYAEAVGDMLRLTGTAGAPWTIVEAEDKPYARVKVLRTVIDALEGGAGRNAPP